MTNKNDVPALFNWFRLIMNREVKHKGEPCPLLEAFLPILEYTPEQLKSGGFLDSVLTAGIRSCSRIHNAAVELEPLGICEDDLLLLLQSRMREQIKKRRKANR
jgi:hypothetical protein